jgi:hypothetical protein
MPRKTFTPEQIIGKLREWNWRSIRASVPGKLSGRLGWPSTPVTPPSYCLPSLERV